MTDNAPRSRLVVGLTGGIGSGKTAASQLFEAAGVTVVDADLVAREVVVAGSQALQQIAAHFGPQFLLPDGSLDRKALRARVFSDPAAKQWLEALLHPLIRHETERQLREARSVYTILSSPLLLETDQHLLVDRILVIDAPEQQQIQRTQVRDATTAAAVQSIMAAQLDREQRRNKADDLIVNDKDLAHLSREVDRLHRFYTDYRLE